MGSDVCRAIAVSMGMSIFGGEVGIRKEYVKQDLQGLHISLP